MLIGREMRYLDVAGGDVPENWEIWRMDADCTNLRRLTDAPGDDILGGWSPDGSLVVFSSARQDDVDLWTMSADGGRQERLLDWPGVQAAEHRLADGRI